MACSVTQRIKQIKTSDYISLKNLNVYTHKRKEAEALNSHKLETLNPSVVGLIVDYLTRWKMGWSKEESFQISLMGAEMMYEMDGMGLAIELLNEINGLEDSDILSAAKLANFDRKFRAGGDNREIMKTILSQKVDVITGNNVRTMVNLSTNVLREIIRSENLKNFYCGLSFNFRKIRAKYINSGDLDFLFGSYLIDFKVSVTKGGGSEWLQLIIYYLLGKLGKDEKFNSVKKLMIMNPRLGIIEIVNIRDINQEIINRILREIIGVEEIIEVSRI